MADKQERQEPLCRQCSLYVQRLPEKAWPDSGNEFCSGVLEGRAMANDVQLRFIRPSGGRTDSLRVSTSCRATSV
jgi:hypothetical protein